MNVRLDDDITGSAHNLLRAVSGIEMALWDLAGKILDVPTSTLLGGKFCDKVRVYDHAAPPNMLDKASVANWREPRFFRKKRVSFCDSQSKESKARISRNVCKEFPHTSSSKREELTMLAITTAVRRTVLILLLAASSISLPVARAQDTAADLDRILAGDHRDPKNAARDKYRHPQQVLTFFGIRPDMTVVEIWPSTGWWTEILAPLLKDRGKYYAAYLPGQAPNAPAYVKRMEQQYDAKLAARPDLYANVIKTSVLVPGYVNPAPSGSADMVLTFRNVHNWAKAGTTDAMFKAFYGVLKPGGILGVTDHRAQPGTPFEKQIETGYLTEDYVIGAAQKAGFKLMAKSEVNANSKDTKDHPRGVWTLPPTLALGDQDREKYLAIGESDRMTLKFVKP